MTDYFMDIKIKNGPMVSAMKKRRIETGSRLSELSGVQKNQNHRPVLISFQKARHSDC